MGHTRSALRVAVLGPCVLEDGGRDVTPSSPLQRRLLTLLALRSPDPASVESLMDVAWPCTERPKDPRQNLHTHMSRLRRHLDERTDLPSAITTAADGYRLDADVTTSDLRELSALTGGGGAVDGSSEVERLDRALALWRGPSLIDIAESDHGMGEGSRLDELRSSLQEARFEHLLTGPLDLGLVAELEAFTLEHPYRERPHAVLMEVLYHLGRQADALSTYQRLRTRLGEDLGLEPSTALGELESQILTHQVPESRAPQPRPPGEPAAIPPEAPIRPPTALTALVGRADELQQVRAAVGRSRLVTIIGPGGVGKTRLAMELAGELGDGSRPGAVVWCDLTAAVSAADVDHTVALAISARRHATQTVRQAVVAAVADVDVVLFLDNCEQVADAAAGLILEVLTAGRAGVVATARAPLDVPGEELVQVRPMPWEPSSTSDDLPPAVALFCQRAGATGAALEAGDGTDELLRRVCRAVDGLPLGIELAAAQLRNMTLEELAERVSASSGALDVARRSGASRHRSIRSALEWSLDSLDAADRELFTAVSVFSGSFDACGAAVVLDADQADVASGLRALADLSLLAVDTVGGRSRFRLLQTARRIGQERADADGSAPDLVRRHRRWVLDLVQATGQMSRGPAEAEAVRSIEAEIDNIRAVVRRAAAEADADAALTVAAHLTDFGMSRMRDDVADWAELALTIDGASEHPLQASVMAAVALVATNRGDLATAGALAARVLDMDGAATDAALHAHHAVALVSLYSGALADAVAVAGRHLELADAAGEPFYGQIACLVSGLAELYGGAPDRADEWVVRSHGYAQRSGSPSSAAWADYLHAEVLAERDPARAASLFRSAIAAGESVHNHLVTGVARLSLTTLPPEAGHEQEALEAYRQLIESWRSRNDWTHQWTTLQNLAPLLATRGADVDAAVLLGALTTDERAPHLFGDTADRLAALEDELTHHMGSDRLHGLRSSGAALTATQTLDHALVAIAGLLAEPG